MKSILDEHEPIEACNRAPEWRVIIHTHTKKRRVCNCVAHELASLVYYKLKRNKDFTIRLFNLWQANDYIRL